MLKVFPHLLLRIIILILNACQTRMDWQEKLANSVDPINSLQASAFSTTYTRDYWQTQKKAKREVWKYAIKFCDTHPEYPNCIIVLDVLHNRKSFSDSAKN